MTALELFYKWHEFTDDNARDDWYIALSSADKLALLDTRHMLEADPLIVALCERGGVVTSIEPTTAPALVTDPGGVAPSGKEGR